MTRLLSGTLGGRLAPRQRHDERGGEDRDQGGREPELVEPQGSRHQVLALAPLPDAEAGGGRERRPAESSETTGRWRRSLIRPGEQHDADPGGQRDHGRQPRVVDVGGGEAHLSSARPSGA